MYLILVLHNFLHELNIEPNYIRKFNPRICISFSYLNENLSKLIKNCLSNYLRYRTSKKLRTLDVFSPYFFRINLYNIIKKNITYSNQNPLKFLWVIHITFQKTWCNLRAKIFVFSSKNRQKYSHNYSPIYIIKDKHICA